MVSGSVKIGASLSFLVVLVAFLYKRHADEVLQARLKDVLSGLLRAEKKVPPPKVRVAVGFGGCEDIFVNGLDLFNLLNLTTPELAKHHNVVNNAEELTQLMAYFFPQGAAAERYIANDTFFDELVEAASKIPGHRWMLGGNAPAMARRFALEGLDVLLGARVALSVVDGLPDSVKVIGETLPKSDVHLLMEYDRNDKWGKYVSPRGNRLIVHSDNVNPYIDGMEAFIEEVVKFQPSLVVIGGLQMMDGFPYEKGVRQARLQKLRDFLKEIPRSTHIHFEMASFADEGLLNEIIENVVYFSDSLGMNEQELPNILNILQGGNVSLVSDSYPRVASVLDEMRTVYSLLKDTKEIDGRRKLTRLHVHTLAFQAILTTKESSWKNTMSAAAKAALTAHRYTCGSHQIDPQKARLIMDESFSLSKTPEAGRIPVNDTRPVSCWQEDGFDLCVAPVLVCTNILQTGGGGDNVSAAGLVLQV
ncbi:ADP-dependent glucokinase [Aplysia californica]|uniref:ADP-dependent glucokinase n=1 Tax=Aplysia californica TaxID=6500 RepID=A0ABM0K1T1_APLCA|nr:ADP-dependent glucokinase [Aplysia californica]